MTDNSGPLLPHGNKPQEMSGSCPLQLASLPQFPPLPIIP